MGMKEAPTIDEIRSWGAVVDVPRAGSAFRLSRNRSYELVRAGKFPVKVIKIGGRYRVPVAGIIEQLTVVAEAETVAVA